MLASLKTCTHMKESTRISFHLECMCGFICRHFSLLRNVQAKRELRYGLRSSYEFYYMNSFFFSRAVFVERRPEMRKEKEGKRKEKRLE